MISNHRAHRSAVHMLLIPAIGLGVSIALLFPLPTPTVAMGALIDKTISGYVYDLASQPINGASVVVEIWGGSWPDMTIVRFSDTKSTDLWGYYEVIVDANFWDPHNTIIVTVTYESSEKTRIVEADADQYQSVDVSMPITIPELGAPANLTLAVSGLIGAVVIISMTRRKRALTEQR